MTDPVTEFFEAFAEAGRRLAHSRIEQRFAEARGLDLLAYRLMLHIRADGARVGDLASRVVAHASHTSRALGVLESRGWVTREGAVEDRRVVLVRPTAAGLAASREIRAELRGALAECVAGWGAADLATAAAMMRRLADGI